ncbi:MAG: hypothetical protein HOQ05_07630 [Corynebacteriales bacterium]|nr:hypothetical protein [Mycobacteriales bacterium]
MPHVPHWLEHPTSSHSGRTAAHYLSQFQGAQRLAPLLSQGSDVHPRTIRESNWGFLAVPRTRSPEGTLSPALWVYSAGVGRDSGGRDDLFEQTHQRAVLDDLVGRLRASGQEAFERGDHDIATWFFIAAKGINTLNTQVTLSVERRWQQISTVSASRFTKAQPVDADAGSFASAVAGALTDELGALPNTAEWHTTLAQNEPLAQRVFAQLDASDPAHDALANLRNRLRMPRTPAPKPDSSSVFSSTPHQPGDLQVIVNDPKAPLRYVDRSIRLERLLDELRTHSENWTALFTEHGPQRNDQHHWFDAQAVVAEAGNRLSREEPATPIDSVALAAFLDDYNNAALSLMSLLPESTRRPLVHATLETYYHDSQPEMRAHAQPQTAAAITALSLDFPPQEDAFFIPQGSHEQAQQTRTARDMRAGSPHHGNQQRFGRN